MWTVVVKNSHNFQTLRYFGYPRVLGSGLGWVGFSFPIFQRNYNEILHYDNDTIYCGHFNMTYGQLLMAMVVMPNETCKMKTGEDEPILILNNNLMKEYSFEKNHKIEEL